MSTFDDKSDNQLQSLIPQCWEAINGVLNRFHDGSDMQAAVKQLMQASNIVGEFSELSDESPELANLILHASVAALVNTQTIKL